MTINSEYQYLIDIITKIIDSPKVSNEIKTELQVVKSKLVHLGSHPIINDSVKQFTYITNNMAKTYAAKNHDYGNSFEQSLDKFGLLASLVRMGDKMNRLESLNNKNAEVKDESIKDTLLDLASYSIMTVMWLNKNNKD